MKMKSQARPPSFSSYRFCHRLCSLIGKLDHLSPRFITKLFSFNRRFSVDDARNVSRAELLSCWATVVPARRWEIPATPPGISEPSVSAPGCSSSPRLPGTRSRCGLASRTTLRSVLLLPDDGDLWTKN